MKFFKVWIEIKQYDDSTQTGETLDAPGAIFDTYEQAVTFAEELPRAANLHGELLAALKSLCATADAAFLDILQTGQISHQSGHFYRKAKAQATAVLAKAEGQPMKS